MIYKNKKWKELRDRVLKRDKYMCQECRRYGKNKDAQMVHHMFPIRDIPEYAYLKENLISLCNKCHNEMHDRNTDELTAKGEALLSRYRERVETAWLNQSNSKIL